MTNAVLAKRLKFAEALERRGLSLDLPPDLARSAYLDAIEEVYGRAFREATERRDAARSDKKQS